MSIDLSHLPLQPRTCTGCFDLSLQCLRSFLPRTLKIWGLMGLPSALLVYVLAIGWGLGIQTAILVMYGASIPLGFATVGSCIRSMTTNGLQETQPAEEPSTFRRISAVLRIIVLRTIIFSGPFLLLLIAESRGFLFAISAFILCLIFCIRSSFILEKLLLTLPDQGNQPLKPSRPNRNNLLNRFIGITFLCSVLHLVMLITLEFTLLLVFQRSLFWQQLTNVGFGMRNLSGNAEAVLNIILSDPELLAAHVAIGLMVYQVGRLAWTFCYIDSRVRLDCWDVELQLREQTSRLRGIR